MNLRPLLTLTVLLIFSFGVQSQATPQSERNFSEKLEQEACRVLLASSDEPPRNPGQQWPTYPAGTLWTVLTNPFSPLQALRQRQKQVEEWIRYGAEKAAFDGYMDRLDDAYSYLKRELGTEPSLGTTSDVSALFREELSALQKQSLELLNKAQTLEQVRSIETFYSNNLRYLRTEASKLELKKKEARDKLLSKKRLRLRYNLQPEVDRWVDVALKKLSESLSENEVAKVLSEALEEISRFEVSNSLQEAERRRREQRFDLSEKDNSRSILEAFLSQDRTGQIRLDESAMSAISRAMERDPKIKAFLYHELQLTRRVLILTAGAAPVDAERIQKAVSFRLANDIWAIQQVKADRKTKPLLQLELLRKALIRMNNPELMKRFVKDGIRHMGLYEREGIIRDATTHEELRYAILASVTELQSNVIAPIPPKAPSKTPPSPPSIPSRGTRLSRSEVDRVKREIANYKASHSAWRDSWAKYKRDASKYNAVDLPQYRSRVAKLRGAQVRRNQARQALSGYLASALPGQFQNPSVASRLNAGVRSQPTSYSTSANGSSSSAFGTDLWFWLCWFELTNPPAQAHTWDDVYVNDSYHHGTNPAARAEALLAFGLTEKHPIVSEPLEPSANSHSSSGWQMPETYPSEANAQMPEASLPDIAADRTEQGMDILEAPLVEAELVELPDFEEPKFAEPSFEVPNYSVEDRSTSNYDYGGGGSDSGGGGGSDSGGGSGGGD